jgi:hypothetical protein
MSFSDLVFSADEIIRSTFGEITATVHPASGAEFTAVLTSKNPVLEPDFIPGADPGPAVLYLFAPRDTPRITEGDTITINFVHYDVFLHNFDNAGAQHIRIRKRNQVWSS